MKIETNIDKLTVFFALDSLSIGFLLCSYYVCVHPFLLRRWAFLQDVSEIYIGKLCKFFHQRSGTEDFSHIAFNIVINFF
jgi:hypothetical protein